jgi:transcriptional regulator with PAS, ATPase and Fis domain
MINALAIMPYEGLYEMMKDIAVDMTDFHLDIELGNLEEGAAIAKNAENVGYHVIISRGGTASMIQEVVSIPVIDIQVSGYDMLRILTLVKGFSEKAVIVGFSNITRGAATICKLLDFEMETVTITSETEVREKLIRLKKQGVEVVIGDVITVQTAREIGLTGILITSGKEAILDSLEEARRVYRLYSKMQQKISFYQSVLNGGDQAVAVIDDKDHILYGNQHFYQNVQWLKAKNSPQLKTLIQETTLMKKKRTKTVTINEIDWKITAEPKDAYILLFMAQTELEQMSETSYEENVDAIEISTFASYVPLTGKSKPIEQVSKQIDTYSSTEETIWISGEKGIGKSIVAQVIYFNREFKDAPFITIHGNKVHVDQLTNLLTEDFFQTYENGVIYLKNIDQLNKSEQKELYRTMVRAPKNRVKWLASSAGNMEETIKKGTFLPELYEKLSDIKIHLPPLRERREDIEDLAHVFISELHLKYGNEVAGIREDAMTELINYDWPGNISQLKRVMEQLFLKTNAFYIDQNEVELVLKQSDAQVGMEEKYARIDLSGTLDDIEKQVIDQVLKEEDYNQSKAAKRLGINRSTLWRKLKE